MAETSKRRPKRLRRTSPLTLVLGALSIMSSLVAVFLATRPSGDATASEAAPMQIVSDDDMIVIPTPARAVARGEKLGAVPIANVKWPKSRLSADFLTDLADYKEAVTLTPLPKLIPIPVSAITTGALDNNQVTQAIPAGMRAITVRVDAESAVEGWAQSGNHVDVLLVRASQDQAGGLETRVIAENIKILSAERSAEPRASEQMAPKAPSTVTLLTSQEDALKIKTATNLGKITFALRGIGDQLPTASTSLDQKTLLGSSRQYQPTKKSYKGMAKAADGKTYVLDEDHRWLESSNSLSRQSSSSSSISNATNDAAGR